MAGFDVVATWPDLFDGLTEAQRDQVRQAFAIDYLSSGEKPARDQVKALVDFTTGRIDFESYQQRSTPRAGSDRAGG